MATTPGERLLGGRYALLHELGSNDSEHLWAARDTTLGRQVLVRVLDARLIGDQGARDWFQSQARADAAHGFDASGYRVLDAGEDSTGGVPFVVLQDVDPPVDAATTVVSIFPDQTQRISVVPSPQPLRGETRVSVTPPTQRPATPAPSGSGGPLALVLVLAAVLLAFGALLFGGRFFGAPAVDPPPSLPAASAGVQNPATAAALAAQERPTSTNPTPGLPPTAAVAVPAATSTAVPRPTATAVPTATAAPTPRAAAVPSPTPPPATAVARAPTPPPAAAALSAAGDPGQAIQTHYALITARRYDEGYNLMAANLRSANTPAVYASWFTNKVSLQPLAINVVSQTPDQAVVETVVRSTDRVDGREVTQDVAERFLLVPEAGAWRIAQVTRLS